MKFLFVTDERYAIGPDGQGYAFFPHQFDFICEQLPEITELVVYARLVEKCETRQLIPCPAQVGQCQVRFAGPRHSTFKLSAWPGLLARSLFALRREVRTAKVIFFKIPAMFPSLGHHFVREGQIVAAYLIGNPRETIPILLPRLKWVAPVVERYCRKIVARADVASFVSTALLEEYGLRRNDEMITNNCSIRRNQVVKSRRVEVGTPPVVTYLGRLSREKGLAVLFEAFAIVAGKMDVHLHIIGAGPMRQELEELAERLGISERVTWYGRVPPGEPFFAALARGDTIVLPSFSEGMPSVIPEAMSQGLPVVASNVGGIPEILQHGEAGILVPPGEPEVLAEGIQRSLTDRALRERLIKKSLELAVENCMENQAGRLVASIASLLRGQA